MSEWSDMSIRGLLNQRVGLVQSGHHHYRLIKMELVHAMIWLKNANFGVKQQSLTPDSITKIMLHHEKQKTFQPNSCNG